MIFSSTAQKDYAVLIRLVDIFMLGAMLNKLDEIPFAPFIYRCTFVGGYEPLGGSQWHSPILGVFPDAVKGTYNTGQYLGGLYASWGRGWWDIHRSCRY